MKDADRIREIERLRAKRQGEDIGLNQVDACALADIAVGRVDRRREVDAEHLSALRRGSLCESPGADTGIQQPAASIFVVAPPGSAAQRLLRPRRAGFRIELHGPEPVPLAAETVGVQPVGHEARNAAANRIAQLTGRTCQRPVQDFLSAGPWRPCRSRAALQAGQTSTSSAVGFIVRPRRPLSPPRRRRPCRTREPAPVLGRLRPGLRCPSTPWWPGAAGRGFAPCSTRIPAA